MENVSKQACDKCRKRKRKCLPISKSLCQLCHSLGALCTFSPKAKRGPKFKKHLSNQNKNYIQNDAKSLTKIPRLSPSSATGFLGFVENEYINLYFSSYRFCGCTFKSNDAAKSMQLLFDFHSSDVSTDLSLMKQKATNSAKISILWIAVAFGALMMRNRNLFVVESYIKIARKWLKLCYDEISVDILRAYLLLAMLSASMEEYNWFSYYVEASSKIAFILSKNENNNNQYVDEDLWFFLEALKYLKHFHESNMPKNPNTKETKNIIPICSDSIGPCRKPANCLSQTSLVSYAPLIDGLPTFKPSYVQNIIEKDGSISSKKAKIIVYNNLISSALTQLLEPGSYEVESLIKLATRNKTNFLPMALSLDIKIDQITDLMIEKSIEHALVPAKKIHFLMKRVLERMNHEFYNEPGYIQFKLLGDLTYLELFCGDEKKCSEYLFKAIDMFVKRPGLLRFPAWRNKAKGLGCLLIAGNFKNKFLELREAYNELKLCSGTDIFFSFEDKSWQMKHWGMCLYKIILHNMAENKAAIFKVQEPIGVVDESKYFDIEDISPIPTALSNCDGGNLSGQQENGDMDELSYEDFLDESVFEMLEKEFINDKLFD